MKLRQLRVKRNLQKENTTCSSQVEWQDRQKSNDSNWAHKMLCEIRVTSGARRVLKMEERVAARTFSNVFWISCRFYRFTLFGYVSLYVFCLFASQRRHFIHIVCPFCWRNGRLFIHARSIRSHSNESFPIHQLPFFNPLMVAARGEFIGGFNDAIRLSFCFLPHFFLSLCYVQSAYAIFVSVIREHRLHRVKHRALLLKNYTMFWMKTQRFTSMLKSNWQNFNGKPVIKKIALFHKTRVSSTCGAVSAIQLSQSQWVAVMKICIKYEIVYCSGRNSHKTSINCHSYTLYGPRAFLLELQNGVESQQHAEFEEKNCINWTYA